MSENFQLTGLDLDLAGLLAEVERRAGPGPDEPPKRGVLQAAQARALEPNEEPGPSSVVAALLRRLAEDSDVTQGFPPQSHRALGGAVVAAKKGFRLALQPFINDAFARQKAFNSRLLDTIAALYAENQALEQRLRRLESSADGAAPPHP